MEQNNQQKYEYKHTLSGFFSLRIYKYNINTEGEKIGKTDWHISIHLIIKSMKMFCCKVRIHFSEMCMCQYRKKRWSWT